jgi:hypothetical protein
MRNEVQLVERIGRVRQRRIVTEQAERAPHENPNVLRDREGGFTAEQDRLIIEAGSRPRTRRKWEDLRGRYPQHFSGRTGMQLKDRFVHLKRRGLVVV